MKDMKNNFVVKEKIERGFKNSIPLSPNLRKIKINRAFI